MGFLSGLFGKKKVAETRPLSQPAHLQVGDMITLDDSFALPADLRGQQLRVEAVNTYEYERRQQTEWVLKGHGNSSIFLSVDEDDESHLCFSTKINRNQVETLFDMDQFGVQRFPIDIGIVRDLHINE